jgi:ornithine carbamoyltransferase
MNHYARRHSDGLPLQSAAIRDVRTRPRHLLSILDLTAEEVLQLCHRAVRIKHTRTTRQTLRGRTVGVYFRQSSTRTRTSFLVGAGRLGATTIYYGPHDLQTTTGETIEDTVRVLAGYLDILVMRTNESIKDMNAFAAQGRMAVVNAFSADEHPTQALADLATILEHFGRLNGISVLYSGEGNKTAVALALAISRIRGMRLTLATPEGYGLPPGKGEAARRLAAANGASVEEVHDLELLPAAVDVVYTSRWQELGVSKPDPDWKRRFAPFRVTRALLERLSGPNTVFMHDLPAVRGEDVDDDVLDGPRSLAWVQAQHKLSSAMSVLEWCGGSPPDRDSPVRMRPAS